MDGRWKLVVAGGILAGAVGCNSMSKRPADQMPAAVPPQQVTKTAPPPAAEPPRTDLKPTTYVSMGALTEQAANEPDRPQAERDAFHRQARQSYQKAIKVDPKFAPAYVALGESYMATGERDQAQAWFKKATEIAPNDPALWSELGAAQARFKDWPAAIASLTRAAQLDPGNKSAETRLGLAQARAGRYEDALNTLAKAMPEAEARYNVARMMKHNQHTEAAGVQLQLALQADPAFEPARALLAERNPISEYGVQQAGYQQPAAAQAPIAPAAAAPPRLDPVQLGGGAPIEPAAVGVAGRSE